MFHIIRRIHHILLYVVDHFTLKMKFWRKNTLLKPVDIRLMNLKERLQNIKSYFHKSMMYILGDDIFSALACKGKREWEARAHSSHQTRNAQEQGRQISPSGRNKTWPADNIPCVGGMFQQPKLKVTHSRPEIPGVSALGKDIDDFHTGFNSSLGNAHTWVPQNSGIRMSMRDKFQLITMNEIWQWNGGLVKNDSKSVTCVSVHQKK